MVVIVLLLAVPAVFVLIRLAPGGKTTLPAPTPAIDAGLETNMNTTPTSTPGIQLRFEDLVTGTGATATPGASVTVHYSGTLTDGTQFDSSYGRGVPFSFKLGARQVIPGWELGVSGMQVGGKRRLTIPPELAYGSGGVPGVIPPDSTLIFTVELMGVESGQ